MEDDELSLEIFDSGDFLRLVPLEYIKYDSALDWDKNWINTRVEVKADAFTGQYNAQLKTQDFKVLKNYFEYIYNNLSGEFEFNDLERYIKLELKGDGIGHFEIYCTVSDKPGYMESSLSFYLSIDQTQIMPIVRQLGAIMEQYPVIGDLWN